MSISTCKEDIILVFEPKLSSQIGLVAASMYLGFNRATKKGEYSGLLRTVSFTDIAPNELNDTRFFDELNFALGKGIVRLIEKNVVVFLDYTYIQKWIIYPIYFSETNGRKILQIKSVSCISEHIESKNETNKSLLHFKKHLLIVYTRKQEKTSRKLCSPSGVIRIEKIAKGLASVSFDIEYDSLRVAGIPKNDYQLRDFLAEQEIIEKFQKASFIKAGDLFVCPVDDLYLKIKFLSLNNFKVFKNKKPVSIYQNSFSMIPTSNKMDWFELSGDLSIGQSKIPLAALAQALKTTQNWIEIDDSVVLVPSSFKQLLKESTVSKKGIKVPVKAYSLLQSFMDDTITQAENKGVPSLFSVDRIKFNLQSKSFKGKLRPYQEVGVNWLLFLHANGIGGVLGDEMGLGKTIQAICAICIISESSPNPILIISPKTLLFNWEKELSNFAPQVSFTTYHGQGRRIQSDSKVILSTYGTMANDIDEFVKIQFTFAIFDEAQVIKNAKTRNHKNCCLIQAHSKIALTGTPIENSEKDLWSIYHLVFPGFFGTFAQFSHRFSHEKDFNSLKRHISPVLLRRRKEDVLSDLPPKIVQVVFNEMESVQQELYNSLVLVVKSELEKTNSSHMVVNASVAVLNALLRLRQLCCHPLLLPNSLNYCHAKESSKFGQFCTLLDSLIGEKEKIVVFSEFTSMLSIIEKHLVKMEIGYQRLDGSTQDRKKIISNFETGDYQVLIISIKAGGVGINLTSAHNVIIYDPWWNPAVENQAIDRLHRIGQKLPVTVYKLITSNTIEEKIQKLQNRKNDLFDTILEPENIDNLLS